MTRQFSRRDILRLGLSAGVTLSPLGLAGCGGNGGAADTGSVNPPPPPSGDGYKALVCVLLLGGNDAYNMLVPVTQEKYARYGAARGFLAIGRSSLLPLNGVAADGAAYGLHPKCAEMADLFNGGRAALVTNVGNLAAPITRADFLAARNLPARLFSHNDQRDQWSTAQPAGNGVDGWGGRIADILAAANAGALLPMNLSIAGANLYQTGHLTRALTVSTAGPQHLASLAVGSPLRAAYDALQALPRSNLFERQYVTTHRRGIDMHAQLEQALAATAPLATGFPDGNDLATQLKLVAQIIAARSRLALRRQIFFVSLLNFDTHDAQATRHPLLLQRLSQALGAFDAATRELGVADRVTTFTISDFGRSLTVNSDGTDHGWASHQFVMGGAVRGGMYYGTMPSLEVDAADDSRGGRFIPTTAVDEYAASFARWFGVADSDLSVVVPNLSRFATRGLGFL